MLPFSLSTCFVSLVSGFLIARIGDAPGYNVLHRHLTLAALHDKVVAHPARQFLPSDLRELLFDKDLVFSVVGPEPRE